MAKASSPQNSGKTKQRIVGTAVLVALFVIIVLILPSREDDEVEVLQRVEIPPKPADLKVKVLPIEKPKPPREVNIPEDLPADPVVAQPDAPAQPEPVEVAKAESATKPVAENTLSAATDGGEWVIQVGSFSSAENASALHDRLKADNYKVFVDEITVAGVSSHRVLVGPNPDRAKLEPFKAKLEKLLNAPAIIKSYAAE